MLQKLGDLKKKKKKIRTMIEHVHEERCRA